MVYQPITESFEARRRLIMKTCDEDERNYINDEYTKHDFEALLSIQQVMLDLLQYEPGKRASVQQALSCIRWIDHRGDNLNKSRREREGDSEECELAQKVTVL